MNVYHAKTLRILHVMTVVSLVKWPAFRAIKLSEVGSYQFAVDRIYITRENVSDTITVQ